MNSGKTGKRDFIFGLSALALGLAGGLAQAQPGGERPPGGRPGGPGNGRPGGDRPGHGPGHGQVDGPGHAPGDGPNRPPSHNGRPPSPPQHGGGRPPPRPQGPGGGPDHNFYRGGRLPPYYRTRHYVVNDWRVHHLRQPPRGYYWVQTGGDYLLVAIATGIIAEVLLNP